MTPLPQIREPAAPAVAPNGPGGGGGTGGPPRSFEPGSAELLELSRALANAVEGEVRFGLHDRMLYATDASIYQVEPLGVVVPSSAEDAVRAVEFCRRHGLPVLPRGGGTSLAGQCVNRAVVIDLSAACTGLLEVNAAERWCRVEAGLTVDDLNDAVRADGLFFAPDPSTSRQANIGGCIGNNAAGTHSVLYGRTSENVLGVDACLADGRRVRLDEGAGRRDPLARELAERVADIVRRHAGLIRERFPKTLRRSAGYQLDVILQQLDELDRQAGGPGRGDPADLNLAPLLCGSEGTLAVTLGAQLRLHPVPRAKGLAVIAFDELDTAIEAVLPMLEYQPAAVELLDDLIMEVAKKNVQQRANVARLPAPEGAEVKAVLYVELFSDTPGDTFDHVFGELRDRFGDDWVATSTDPAAMHAAWALRRAGEPLLHAIDSERKPLGFIEDNAIPPERLGEFVTELRAELTRHGTVGSFYAHASVGVLHVRPLLNPKKPEDLPKMRAIARFAADLAKRLGGVMSGEHGDGRARGPFLDDYFGPELMAAFGEVKAVFDVENRLNPGNIVTPAAAESISEDLRVAPRRPDGQTRPAAIADVETYFDYEDQHGFVGAVEMCNGAGVCRKKTGGTMCPSYMATRDERHSTRGRGNALRLAISGQLGEQPGRENTWPDKKSGADPSRGPGSADPQFGRWTDPETKATLDLCLSCKACKAECPSNVDIARLKAEYTAQGYRAAGRVPLQARVFGSIDRLSRLAGLAPGLANAASRVGPARLLFNRVLGLHPERSLPAFATPLPRQWKKVPPAAEGLGPLPDAPRVVLYADTFTAYNEPHIGLAARRLLEGLGYRVELFGGTDAARAMMSVGLLGEAIAAIDAELVRLREIAADPGVAAVVHCEPSVLSAVLDDWRELRVADPHGVRGPLAAKSCLVEQFVADRWAEHPRRPGRGVAFGGHGASAGESSGPTKIILHGHCHQKALWGAESSGRALELALPGRVRTLDSGCCGMAGSFGYTRGRYELSMKIGEQVLFPAVRESAAARGTASSAGPPALIAAPGTSCRHQILDGTGVHARHPVEILAAAMRPGRSSTAD